MMTKDEFRELVHSRLEGKSREQCAAFMLRISFRLLPMMAYGRGSKEAFWFWPEPNRGKHLLAVFRAQAYALGRINGVKTAAAYAAAFDAAFDATYAAAATTAAYAYAAAAAADDADADVAYAAYAATATISTIKSELLRDINLLSKFRGVDLLQESLWISTPLTQWLSLLTPFKRDALSLSPSFAVWLDWYEARLAGQAANLEQLEQWLNLPAEIAGQSPEHINIYLARLVSPAPLPLAPLQKRVRAIFLGDGEAGKTSLLKALRGEAVVEGRETMTPGIAIHEWPDAGEHLIAHCWDFGGQVIAHATHQFFLRARCLYVLLLSSRAGNDANDQAEYWLQHVRAFGNNAPVLIVCNKLDVTEIHLNESSLRGKYPNIVGIFKLACTQAKKGELKPKFLEFRLAFIKHLHQLAENQVRFTESEFSLVQQLQVHAKTSTFLRCEEFNAWCTQRQFEAKQSAWLLDTLDNLGLITHFPNMPFLESHLLNPRWLTYGVYTLMYGAQALLSEQDIVAKLHAADQNDEFKQELAYTKGNCRLIVDAMEQFKLSYRLPNKPQQMIIPSLLATDTPSAFQAQADQRESALAYKLVFTGFMPRHVLSQLIVMRHLQIEGELVWQFGVSLASKEPQARAWLQVDFHEKMLTVWVAGRDQRQYLDLLRNDLNTILQSTPDIAVNKLLRLPEAARLPEPGHAGQTSFKRPLAAPEWAEFSQVESCLRRGQATFISAGDQAYDLRTLADLCVVKENWITNNFYGENPRVSQGDQNINIENSDIAGNVSLIGSMQNSQIKHTTNEIGDLLSEILRESEKLRTQVNAKQAEALNEIVDCVGRIEDESKRSQPKSKHYQLCIDGLLEAAKELQAMGLPIIDTVEGLRELLK